MFLFEGLLVAKKHVFRNQVPSGAGGGTVLYVSFLYPEGKHLLTVNKIVLQKQPLEVFCKKRCS